MQQWSGVNIISYYSTSIFSKVGFADPAFASTFLSLIHVIATMLGVRVVDLSGRKVLLKSSWVGMVFSFTLFTICFLLSSSFEWMNLVRIEEIFVL